MRIDLGLVLGILLECIIFIYYADALFTRKRNKLFCRLIAITGYAIHFVGCMFGNIIVNIAIFMIINFISLKWCYIINLKNAIFQTIVLVSISSASEWVIVCFDFVGINANNLLEINDIQSMILTLMSKVIYLIIIMILLNIFSKKKKVSDIPSIELIFVSVLILVVGIFIVQNIETSNFVSIIFIILIIINLIIFYINQRMIIKNEETQILREQAEKEKLYYEEYKLLKENYENIRILRHDFKEHIRAIEGIVDNKKASEYIRSVSLEEENNKYVEYTNNKMLNVLLSQKKKECNSKGIEFVIEPIIAKLDFISDMDVTTIFSNLINNAMESSIKTDEKKIIVNIYEVNKKFVTVKLENSCDEKPIVIDGKFKTNKNDENLHGIGIMSVKKTIKKYSGSFDWAYNDEEKKICFNILLANR